jgi:type 1 glutamine amidotransferase
MDNKEQQNPMDTFTPDVQAKYDIFCKEQIQEFDWMDEIYYMETETEQETLFMTLLHKHQ